MPRKLRQALELHIGVDRNLLESKLQSTLLLLIVLLTLSFQCYSQPNYSSQESYGANRSIGKYAEINGIKMYYEFYGEGEPLVLIHGNGQSIIDLKHQIKYLSTKFKVLVADSRGHGKSDLNTKKLTYGMMVDDWFTLLSHLGLKKVNVFGWSDGGVIGLKLTIQHPELINKLAIMGTNTLPPEHSAYPWAIKSVNILDKHIDEMIAVNDTSNDWRLSKQLVGLLFSDPEISNAQLASIKAPVLVMAGDKDVIIAEHTLSIFQNLKNSHLAIFSGQTHFAPITDPTMFNSTLGRFFISPFKRPDTRDYFK